MEVQQLPSTCSFQEYGNLPDNVDIQDQMAGIKSERKEEGLKPLSNRTLLDKAIADLGTDDELFPDDDPGIMCLDPTQSLYKKYALSRGWKEVGTYPGDAGTISVLVHGLKSPRK